MQVRKDQPVALLQARFAEGEMAEAMSMGMQMSVICTEDAGSMVVRAEDADTVLGNRMVEAMAAMCEVWPKGDKPEAHGD